MLAVVGYQSNQLNHTNRSGIRVGVSICGRRAIAKPRAEIWAQPNWRTYIDAWIDRIVLAFLALVFATMVLGY